MNFNLKKPCDNCPFLRSARFTLTTDRCEEIVECVTEQDGTFACHKTVTYDDYSEDVEDYVRGEGEEHCAGVLIMLENMEQPNQMMRVAERCGVYDREKLDMDADVYEDFDEFIEQVGD